MNDLIEFTHRWLDRIHSYGSVDMFKVRFDKQHRKRQWLHDLRSPQKNNIVSILFSRVSLDLPFWPCTTDDVDDDDDDDADDDDDDEHGWHVFPGYHYIYHFAHVLMMMRMMMTAMMMMMMIMKNMDDIVFLWKLLS